MIVRTRRIEGNVHPRSSSRRGVSPPECLKKMRFLSNDDRDLPFYTTGGDAIARDASVLEETEREPSLREETA